MPPSPEIPQTPHERLLVDAVEILPTASRTDVALQLQDEAAENPITSIFSPVDSKRAEILLGWVVARAKLAELSKNRAIAVSINLTEEQLRAATVEGSAGFTQGNRVYQPHNVESDGTSISNRRYRDILLVRQHELLNPQARIEWGKWMRRELRRLGPDQIREYQSRIEDYGLVGLMPSLDVLWMGVRLEAAKNDLAGLVGNGGAAAPSLRETMVFADQLLSGGAIDPAQAFQRMSQGTAMGRTMMTEYQQAFTRWRDAYLSFPADVQESILTGIVGGQIMGGQAAILPNFYSTAFKQIGRESSFHSSFFDALAFARKQGGLEGYIPMEVLFQTLGSNRPEIIGFIDHANSVHDLWVEQEDLPERLRNDPEYRNNPDKSLHFRLSSREMMGVYGSPDMLARLGINTAQDIVDVVEEVRTKEGFWSVRNNAFARYVFHKMGYSGEEIDRMFEEKRFPRLRRAGDLSKVTGNEITDFWDWVGEVALDKMILALTWTQWSRWDVEAAPLDFKRRLVLSYRGVFLSAYRLGYGLGLPPEQFRNMIALFGSVPSLDRKSMIGPIVRNLHASDSYMETLTGRELELARFRSGILDETSKLRRPILSASRTLSRIVMGEGSFATNNPEEYRRLLKDAMREVPKIGEDDALRIPEFWKYRWFKNVDRYTANGNLIENPINEWQFIEDEIELPENGRRLVTQQLTQDVFTGIDFTPLLLETGLRQDEVDAIDHSGFDGWKNYLRFANFGVLHWSELGYTTPDKNPRYLQKVDKTGDVSVEFLEVSSTSTIGVQDENVVEETGGLRDDLPRREVHYSRSPATHWTGTHPHTGKVLAAMSAQTLLTEALSKASAPFGGTLSFIPNDLQARFIEANFDMLLDGHCAHSLSSGVEALRVKDLKGGDNFQADILYEHDIPQWKREILKSEGFYFLPDYNDKKGARLISPLAAPLPKIIRVDQLIGDIKTFAQNEIAQGRNIRRYRKLITICEYMEKNKAFCWDSIVSGRADITPNQIDFALRGVKEEGAMTAVTIFSMRNKFRDFISTDHPGVRLYSKARLGKRNDDSDKAFVIPLLAQ